MIKHEKIMQKVLEIAAKGTGNVSPNPKVGAIIVKEGKIVSQGFHEKYGKNHAEVNAINNANMDTFEDCTLYVNLEPCSHYGKTPPCVDLIISKKFNTVVIGMQDPNPVVAGTGIQKLKDAGINVISGVLESECTWFNRIYIKHITEFKPYIIGKAAMSLDSCIATSKGKSKWITSEDSLIASHSLRLEVDAVLIGANTAIADNPKLTVRKVKGRNPWRVVINENLTLPLSLNIFGDETRQKTIVVTKKESMDSVKVRNMIVTGIKVFPFETFENGNLDLASTIQKLSVAYGFSSILIEGGAQTLSSFVNCDLIDELQLFIAPIIIGDGLKVFGDFKTNLLTDSKKFEFRSMKQLGVDINIVAVKK